MNQSLSRRSRERVLIGAILVALSLGIPQVFAAAEEITGDWELTMDFNGRQTFASLSIAKKPDGTFTGKWGSTDLKDLKFDGQKLTFVRTIQRGDQEFTMDFSGSFKDGKITGNLSSDRGEFQATGARKKPKSPVLGQWDIKFNVMDRDITPRLIISQKPDGVVEAKWTSGFGESVVSNVKIQEGKLTLSRKTTANDNTFESTFEGTVKDNALIGTIKSDMGEVAVAGQRIGSALIGRWEITRTSDQGPRTNLLTIDTDLTGRYESFGGEILIKDLKLDGDQVSFKTEMGFGDQTFVTEFKAKLDGKTLKGQSVSDRGTNELTGKKVESTPPPAPAK
jgi:hypothetical protein